VVVIENCNEGEWGLTYEAITV